MFVNLEIHGHTHIKYLRDRQKASLQTLKYKRTTVFKVNSINNDEEQVTCSEKSLLHRAKFTEK